MKVNGWSFLQEPLLNPVPSSLFQEQQLAQQSVQRVLENKPNLLHVRWTFQKPYRSKTKAYSVLHLGIPSVVLLKDLYESQKLQKIQNSQKMLGHPGQASANIF